MFEAIGTGVGATLVICGAVVVVDWLVLPVSGSCFTPGVDIPLSLQYPVCGRQGPLRVAFLGAATWMFLSVSRWSFKV